MARPAMTRSYLPRIGGVQSTEPGRPPSTHTVQGNVEPPGVVAMTVVHSAAATLGQRPTAKAETAATTRIIRCAWLMRSPPQTEHLGARAGRIKQRSIDRGYYAKYA